jgi:hypothetical protein
MAGDRWAGARAAKERKRLESNVSLSKREEKKVVNTVKKSPVLIIVVVSLILGLVGGFLAFTFLSSFEMNVFSVNGINSLENDYVVVEMNTLKNDYFAITIFAENEDKMEKFYNSINLKDGGFECKFFGVDISDTVSTKYYFREDISHDYNEVESIDVKTPGVYYIEYKSSHFAFKNKTLIRTIIVTGVEVDG